MMDKSPIQTPLGFEALRWFSMPRSPSDAIIDLTRNIQPTWNISVTQRFESVQSSLASVAPGAAGPTLLWENTTNDVHLIFGASYSSAAGLGAGITVEGYLCHTPQLPNATGGLPFMRVSPRESFTVGQSPNWSFWLGYDFPLVLLPGDRIYFWTVVAAGAPPALNFVPMFRVLST